MRYPREISVAGIALAIVVFGTASGDAGVIFSATGTNAETGGSVSAEADFSVSGTALTLILTNTTSGGTLVRGDVLQGVAWDMMEFAGAFSLGQVALTNGSLQWTSKTISNATSPIIPSGWTNVLGTSVSEYGVASTGFGGEFSAGSINPSGPGAGGTPYGIVADGTFPAPPGAGTSNSFSSSAFALFQDSLTFTLTAQGGGPLSSMDVHNVRFLFGTNGRGVLPGTVVPPPAGGAGGVAVPEPSSFGLAGLGILATMLGAVRRRRQPSA